MGSLKRARTYSCKACRPRSGNRTGTRRVKTHPPIEARISRYARPVASSGPCVYTAWPTANSRTSCCGSRSSHGRAGSRHGCSLWLSWRRRSIFFRFGGIVVILFNHADNSHRGWSEEHAMAERTVKVPFALDATIILAGGCLKLDADPIAGRELCLSSKPDDAPAAIGQLDNLSCHKLHVGSRQVRKRSSKKCRVPTCLR